MKGFWLGALVLSLTCLGPIANAQEFHWRPARLRPTSPEQAAVPESRVVELGAPVPLPPPPVLLPEVLDLQPAADPHPTAVADRTSATSGVAPVSLLPPLVRGQIPEAGSSTPKGPVQTADYKVIASTDTWGACSSTPVQPTSTATAVTCFACEGDCAGRSQSPTSHPCCNAPCCPDIARGDQCCCRCPDRIDFSAEALYWWIKDGQAPPLITTGPPGSAGILGVPGTTVLFPGPEIDNEERWGGRFRLGYWFDQTDTWGAEASFFFLGQRSVQFTASSNAFPLVARPFFNLNQGGEFSQVAIGPGTTGSVSVTNPSRLWGVEANLRRNLWDNPSLRVDLLAGFRYLDLQESLGILEQIQVNPSVPMFGGDNINVFDSFATRNHFYGEQIGLSAEYRRGKWSLDLRGMLALGINHEVVDIQGGQTLTMPNGTTSVFQGGLLALQSNIGRNSRDEFAVVPEVGLSLGYQLTDNVRALVGWNFLYASNVLRPGDQIDRVIDVSQIPNFGASATPTHLARPTVPFHESDFWAQGITFGLEFRY